MEITNQTLPKSRLKYLAKLTAVETDQQFEHATTHLAASVKLPGFRAGKAPKGLARQRLGTAAVREEASSLAVRLAWQEIIKELKVIPIEDPVVTIVTFEEGKAAELMFEFDVRPEVKVGDWQKISIKPGTESQVTDEDVAKLISSLSQGHASMMMKLEPAAPGDKMEITFDGSIGHVRKDKLSSKHFPLILGQGTTIPGFDDQLAGLKKGDEKTFSLKFPKDHFDKELAGQEAEFKVVVDEVFSVILPALDAEFAHKFGHDTPKQLEEAIREDLVRQRSEEAFTTQKAKWLAEFEAKVTVDVPASLIAAEVERSREAWRSFLQERHLNETEWLKSRELTLEGMKKDWQKAGEASVKIGLGLAEVAKELKKELGSNDEFQALLDELVKKAIVSPESQTPKTKSKPKK